MSNSIFQSVIGQLREATDRVLGVIDTDGNVVSCTDPVLLGERWSEAALNICLLPLGHLDGLFDQVHHLHGGCWGHRRGAGN